MASLIVDTMKEGYYKIGRNRGYAPEKLSENLDFGRGPGS